MFRRALKSKMGIGMCPGELKGPYKLCLLIRPAGVSFKGHVRLPRDPAWSAELAPFFLGGGLKPTDKLYHEHPAWIKKIENDN